MINQNGFSKIKKLLSGGLVKGALFLCISVFICKIIGIIYRIPLVYIIGANGIGVYQLIFPLYSFLLILSSNALPVAISKIIAQKLRENDYSYIATLKKVSFIVFGCIGAILSLVLIVFCKQISVIQGNDAAYLGYILIAPSIVFVAFISVFRGLFQGLKNMQPTGISQIIEQVIKFACGLGLPYIFFYKGLTFQVAMATLSVTISELVALLYLFIKYHKDRELQSVLQIKSEVYKKSSDKNVAKELLRTTLPIMFNNSIMPICVLIESFLIVNILSNSMPSLLATEVYGIYSGVVNVLINAPIILSSAIGVALVPHISENENSIKSEIKRQNPYKQALFLITIIVVPVSLVFVLFPHFIIGILFPNLTEYLLTIASTLLLCSSINVITQSYSYAITNYMQANSIMYKPVICFAIMNSLRLVLGMVVLYYYGIVGFVLVGAFVYAMQLMQLILIKKRCKILI